jgi:hypothetical protein
MSQRNDDVTPPVIEIVQRLHRMADLQLLLFWMERQTDNDGWRL